MNSLSYWEKDSFFNKIDVLIIGCGIVGLSTAISLKEKNPALKVTILERGSLPSGASTKNAGFACFGSMTELLEDLKSRGADEVFGLVERRWLGLNRLRTLVGDHQLRYQPLGGFEMFSEQDGQAFADCLKHVDEFNLMLRAITGLDRTFKIADDRLGNFGFANIKHLIFNQAEGQLHAGEMMKSLIQIARSLDVQVIFGSALEKFEEEGDSVQVFTKEGWSFKTKKMLLATNGFSRELVEGLDLRPARNQVLVTAPISNLPFQGCFHYDRGYYYFRTIGVPGTPNGQRILLGGGRNLSPAAETTSEFGHTEIIRNALEKMLREVILPKQTVTIDHWWSGILGIGEEKKPIIKMVSPSVGVAVRLGGMGVAIGTLVGNEAAEMIDARL